MMMKDKYRHYRAKLLLTGLEYHFWKSVLKLVKM